MPAYYLKAMKTLKERLMAMIKNHAQDIRILCAVYEHCNEKDLYRIKNAIYFTLDLIDTIERYEENEKENRKI